MKAYSREEHWWPTQGQDYLARKEQTATEHVWNCSWAPGRCSWRFAIIMREPGVEGMMVKLKMIVKHHLSSDIKSLVRTASNLCINFWKIDIFTIVSHFIQDGNRFFHLFCTFLIFPKDIFIVLFMYVLHLPYKFIPSYFLVCVFLMK